MDFVLDLTSKPSNIMIKGTMNRPAGSCLGVYIILVNHGSFSSQSISEWRYKNVCASSNRNDLFFSCLIMSLDIHMYGVLWLWFFKKQNGKQNVEYIYLYLRQLCDNQTTLINKRDTDWVFNIKQNKAKLPNSKVNTKRGIIKETKSKTTVILLTWYRHLKMAG